MEFNEYQKRAHALAIYPQEQALAYTALGLTGEAGEIANKVKKVIRDDYGILTDEKREALIDELGDVLWYLSEAAHTLGVSMHKVAKDNLAKLESRAERGQLQGEGDNR